MSLKKSKKKPNRTRNHLKSFDRFIPNTLKKVVKNRLFIFIATFAIAGFIGNRFDKIAIDWISWLFVKNEYYNFILILLVIVTILLVLVIIVFIRLNDYIAYHPSANSNYEVRESSDEFYSELTKLITTASYKDDLFISIGEGESLNDWLSRIFEENNAGRINSLQIRNIYIKMLSPELCELLEKNHFLSEGFSPRMNKNVQKFRENQYLKDHNIDVKLTYWTKLPTFHGFIYDGYCLVNKWEVNSNHNLHVRTQLKLLNAKDSPDKYNAIKNDFEDK